ncbi:MAG: hypothetical protein JWN98_2413 [Abditibacteriota bacterium]|nr:hypothetical protein [Abditibacteriota bacterium]
MGILLSLYSYIMKVFTMGYEGISIDNFFSILKSHNIELLVDVRELPLSRKPGFSKTALASATLSQGFKYIHLSKLGCPREIRHSYRVDQDWQLYTHRFSAYLDTQTEAVMRLEQLVIAQRCCLLCFEADASYCHRSIVAKRVQQYSTQPLAIQHLTKTLIEAAALSFA